MGSPLYLKNISDSGEEHCDSWDDDDDIQINVTEDEYDSADDQLEENDTITDIVQIGNVNFRHSEFLIVKVSQKQFICEIWDIKDSMLTCKFMRRDFSHLDIGTIRFKWPTIEEINEVDKDNVIGALRKYTKTRRGGLLVNCCLKDKFMNLN